MKWQHYLTSVCFAFLGLFAGSFIINQKNSASAASQTFTFYSGDVIPIDIGFDTSVFSSTPLYFSWSCERNSNGDFNIYIRYDSGLGSSFLAYCTQLNSTVSLTSGTYVLDYIPTVLGAYSALSLSSQVDSFTFTLSDEPSGGGITPSGSLSITSNGTYDVTNYAEAVVEVPNTETIIQGDYHDDLVSINNSIMVCAGVCLVLYFFYCIYRMFIKTGGK